MTEHLEKGKDGEKMACRYLEKRDFIVHCCNWRSGSYEIDIIATKNDVIHFIEVKTRYSLEFGYPEEAVTKRKFNYLKKGAAAFLSRFKEVKKIQFDVLSILIIAGKTEYTFFDDVYMD